MTHQVQDNQFHDVCELLNQHGFEAMKDAMATLINEAMRIERQNHLQGKRTMRDSIEKSAHIT